MHIDNTRATQVPEIDLLTGLLRRLGTGNGTGQMKDC